MSDIYSIDMFVHYMLLPEMKRSYDTSLVSTQRVLAGLDSAM